MQFIDLFLHLDEHLKAITEEYGPLTYVLLFGIVFCETGLVITPFLPGDSLLFAAGALASLGSLDVTLLTGSLIVAAVLGDTVNYHIGALLGQRLLQRERTWLINRKHLEYTRGFFERHGGKTIILARFMPIVRTYAPFVAGLGAMRYRQFLFYNVTGGLAWVIGFVLAGYWFGEIPVVKRNFTLVILAIIFLSVLPGAFEYFRYRRAAARENLPRGPEPTSTDS